MSGRVKEFRSEEATECRSAGVKEVMGGEGGEGGEGGGGRRWEVGGGGRRWEGVGGVKEVKQ